MQNGKVVASHDPLDEKLKLRQGTRILVILALVLAGAWMLLDAMAPILIGDPPLRASYGSRGSGEIEYLQASAEWSRKSANLKFVAMLPVAAAVALMRRQSKERKLLERYEAPTAIGLLSKDLRPPVLYLRPFESDDTATVYSLLGGKTREQWMAKRLSRIGPVVALERPSTLPPPIGARRLFVEDAAWQNIVSTLLPTAACVLYRPGTSNSMMWELRECLRLLPRERIVVDCRGVSEVVVRSCLGTCGIAVQEAALGSRFLGIAASGETVRLSSLGHVVDYIAQPMDRRS